LLVRNAPDRQIYIDSAYRKDALDEAFHHAHDVITADERHFDVDLGKLGLPVGAQVLVAEAADDLIIPLKAAHHEELLKNLRRLGQRVELARVYAAGHQIVTGALGRTAGEHRRLQFQKAVFIEEVARSLHYTVAQDHVSLQRRATEVQVTVAQSDAFVDVTRPVDLEGRRLCLAEHDEVFGDDLDLTGSELRVFHPLEPLCHFSVNADHVLAAQRLRLGKQFGIVRLKDDLTHAGPVTQIDEDESSMVAAPAYPACQADLSPRVGEPQRATRI